MNLMATKNSVDGRQVQHVPIYNTGEQLWNWWQQRIVLMMDKPDMFPFTKQGNGFETDGNKE
jgi:hypothetical protein